MKKMQTQKTVKVELLWKWILFFLIGHLGAVHGLHLLLFTSTKLYTTLFGKFVIKISLIIFNVEFLN